jgi:hypothetical protein
MFLAFRSRLKVGAVIIGILQSTAFKLSVQRWRRVATVMRQCDENAEVN